MLKDILPNFSVGLAPMDEVTTHEYRYICKIYGADVLFTEFVSSDALVRDVETSYKKIAFTPSQRPIAIQIFGNTESTLVEAAQRVEELRPDWIDINWGCPMKKIANKGSGSGILQTPDKMIQITKAVVNSVKIPVSVKTRLGYDEKNLIIDTLAEQLQDVGVQLITIHGRTKMQMYRGEASWDLIGKIKQNPRIKIPIFGNGDIDSAEKMLEYKQKYNVDGILIGRASIGNPFIFKQCKQILAGKKPYMPAIEEKVRTAKRHFNLMVKNQGENRAIIIMKKFYGRYFLSIKNFKAYKMQLMEAKTANEVNDILDKISLNLVTYQ